MTLTHHQYVERNRGLVRSERPFGDWIVNYLYCKKREQPPLIYQLLGSQWFSSLLGWVNYDFPLGERIRDKSVPKELRRQFRRMP